MPRGKRLQPRAQPRLHSDRIRRGRNIDQSAVEIEEQGQRALRL
jgi:hypothetical protein